MSTGWTRKQQAEEYSNFSCERIKEIINESLILIAQDKATVTSMKLKRCDDEKD